MAVSTAKSEKDKNNEDQAEESKDKEQQVLDEPLPGEDLINANTGLVQGKLDDLLQNLPESKSQSLPRIQTILTRQTSGASSTPSSGKLSFSAPFMDHSPGATSDMSKINPIAGAVVPLKDDSNTPTPGTKKTSFDRTIDNVPKISRLSIGKTPFESAPASPSLQTPPESLEMAESTSKRRQKSDREVLVGTPVKEGHVNYMLMYDMLTGIRISVSRCYAKTHREVADEDFLAAHKLAFDVTGNEMTPSSKYDFKFKDYCPWVFRLIRQEFHVDPSYYLLSLTGKYVLSELVSSGKSGSFFYYSQDYRFIIKTIHHSEHKFILKILRFYYEHIKSNPHTFLSRIFGLHRVKLPGNKKIHFVVMGNVFPANKDIHEVYDLKGSLFGRKISEQEAQSNPRAVLKDLNWLERKKKLSLGPQKSALFEKQLEADVMFLMTQGIMDYSLLIGIHDLVRGNQDHIRDQTLSVFEPTSDVLSRRNTQMSRKTKTQLFNAEAKNEIVQLGPSSSKLPDIIPPERRYCIFYSDEGGFRASDSNDASLPEIYYLGIIDISTYYSPAKRLETILRSIGTKKELISAVDPILYGNRFKKFMLDALQKVSTTEGMIDMVNHVIANPSGL